MEPILAIIHNRLRKKQLTLAVAESCTGGLLAKLLTDLPGSSDYFILGVVAYQNKAKKTLLKIPVTTLENAGAVSRITAEKMAQSIRRLANSDLGIGITGIAGPGGGTAAKSKGTVFIAVESKDRQTCRKLFFRGSRIYVRKRAAFAALELLKTIL